jgi:GNAT superfamily N-acetyltransferase
VSHTLKDISFLVIHEDAVSPRLEHQIRDCLVVCFPHEPLFSHQIWWHSKPAYRVIAHTHRNDIVAHAGLLLKPIAVGCAKVPVNIAGIQSFSVMPGWRGNGVSDHIMERTLKIAREHEVEFGMLFCNPPLEKVYHRMGWQAVCSDVVMLDEQNNKVVRDGITMIYPFKDTTFPSGLIDLLGRDW